ncbi:hypothetical protein SNEBB_009487 [Seison nebaliae]|nr:hypothetical protein SNEBB_009487 [Seison nebaliae]
MQMELSKCLLHIFPQVLMIWKRHSIHPKLFQTLYIERKEELHFSFDELWKREEELQLIKDNLLYVTKREKGGKCETIEFYGIFGLIKFLFGYYLILITKFSEVTTFHSSSIYKIDDVKIIYIPNGELTSKQFHHEKQRSWNKKKLLEDVQENFMTFQLMMDETENSEKFLRDIWMNDDDRDQQNNSVTSTNTLTSTLTTIEQRYIKLLYESLSSHSLYFSESFNLFLTFQENLSQFEHMIKSNEKFVAINFNNQSSHSLNDCENCNRWNELNEESIKKYCWNRYLLQDLRRFEKISSVFAIDVMCGFIDSFQLMPSGKRLHFLFICRRSSKMAGVRYLKRGGNMEGDVANEVESEQIISDELFNRFSSFVHIRGSVPLYWSQQQSMIPKPPIIIDYEDPYCSLPIKHFTQLIRRHSSPIVIVNLMKKNYKKNSVSSSSSITGVNVSIPPIEESLNKLPKCQQIFYDYRSNELLNELKSEQLLTNHYLRSVRFIQQYTPTNTLIYYHIDLAAAAKSSLVSGTTKNKSKIKSLTIKEEDEDGQEELCQIIPNTELLKRLENIYYIDILPKVNIFLWENGTQKRQKGVARLNCVDCLDRTNTAAYILGRVAFSFQLSSLGFIRDIHKFHIDSVADELLKKIYESGGDTIAYQYVGSQLVHRVDTYRKTTSLITRQSRDMVQSISRYYSNTFTDNEKQMSLNILHGTFIPSQQINKDIWQHFTDYYWHVNYSFTSTPLHLMWAMMRELEKKKKSDKSRNNERKLKFISSNPLKMVKYENFPKLSEKIEKCRKHQNGERCFSVKLNDQQMNDVEMCREKMISSDLLIDNELTVNRLPSFDVFNDNEMKYFEFIEEQKNKKRQLKKRRKKMKEEIFSSFNYLDYKEEEDDEIYEELEIDQQIMINYTKLIFQ